jgi:hypothetical protein
MAGQTDGGHGGRGSSSAYPTEMRPELPPEMPLYGTPPERPQYGRPGHGLGPEVPLPVPEPEPEPGFEPGFEPRFEAGRGRRVPARALEPGQGILALVLGLVGLFAFPPVAPAAWIIARREIRGIDAGRRHPRGRALGQLGLVLGVVGTVMLGVWMLMGGFVLLVLVTAARSLFGG